MHVTTTKGNVIKMPLGEVVDKILRGDISIDAIPKISVFCLRNTWFSLDNRRLWVFKKLQSVWDPTSHFSITCLERDREFVKLSKITTSNGGADIVVRRDPGGKNWRQLCNDTMMNFKRCHMEAPPPAPHPRIVRLLPHPKYEDLFPESFFHGEDYFPEEEDEWYWREANKYYAFEVDEKFPVQNINNTGKNFRKKLQGRRRHVQSNLLDGEDFDTYNRFEF
ncbi:uncharacterized protein [Argopecten irradians]|uniref:uncharacterized protein n=1 Tax=Argopecten irradians TaxID=31199 RepID=UPI003719DABF